MYVVLVVILISCVYATNVEGVIVTDTTGGHQEVGTSVVEKMSTQCSQMTASETKM